MTFRILEVRADQVKVGDEVWVSRGRYGGGVEGEWVRTSVYDESGTPFHETHVALEDRGSAPANADSPVLVRRSFVGGEAQVAAWLNHLGHTAEFFRRSAERGDALEFSPENLASIATSIECTLAALSEASTEPEGAS